MPTYTYKCKKCEIVEEFVLPMSDRPPVRTHENCGGKMIRYFTPPSVNIRQGQTEKVRDKHGNDLIKHWDGSQDVNINAKPVDLTSVVKPPDGM